MTRYAFAIEIDKCIACHSCAIACKSNNNLPQEIWWNRVETEGGAYMDTAAGEYPKTLSRTYWPINCQHCSNPACVTVCPTGASYVRDDGLVEINAEECINCKSCIQACPYDVRRAYDEEPEYYVDFPLGDWDAPEHVQNTVAKCTGCANRIDRGEVPACMEFCWTRCRHWGDIDDPNSDISKLIASKDYVRLHEKEGTEPNVYYITSKKM